MVRASNNTMSDSHGTVITVESLHDWWEGYQQHRTISLQHNLNLRGIQGKPQVGMATRVDFTPQLEMEIRIDDPEVDRMIAERKITGASLEFLPVPNATELRVMGDRQVEVYHRLFQDPEDLDAARRSLLESRTLLARHKIENTNHPPTALRLHTDFMPNDVLASFGVAIRTTPLESIRGVHAASQEGERHQHQ